MKPSPLNRRSFLRQASALPLCAAVVPSLPMQIETTLSAKGSSQFPSGNWFWHEWDDSIASTAQVKEWLRVAGQVQVNLLVSVGPAAANRGMS